MWPTDFQPLQTQCLHDQQQPQHKPLPLSIRLEPHTTSNLPPPPKRISERSEVALCASSHRPLHNPPTLTSTASDTADYELVRIYHPDSPIARAYPPEVSEVRFHAISVSYDVLRGRRATLDCGSPDITSHPRVDLHALWRAKQRHRQDPMGPADDRWKDGIILGSLVLVRKLLFGYRAQIEQVRRLLER